MNLSVIVPMLNEAAGLPSLLQHLRDLEVEGGCEILLVDGGSTDGSADAARRGGFRVVQAPAGRAVQMNAGARQARGDLLLFLHADTRLPRAGIAAVRAAIGTGSRCWGRFDVRIAGRSWLLPVVGELMNRRSRWSGIATGDQSIFVRRAVFEAVGGFPEQPLMEDIELSRRLLPHSRPACLPLRATTSGRRWDANGALRTVLLMWTLRAAYRAGCSSERLAKLYR